MEGNVAGQDVLLFMPDSNGLLNDWLSNKIFSLSGLVRGKVDQLNIAHFDIGAAGGFSLKSEGNVAFVTDMERDCGRIESSSCCRPRGVFCTFVIGEWECRICYPGSFIIRDGCAYCGSSGESGCGVKSRAKAYCVQLPVMAGKKIPIKQKCI